jgi:hypothetical protein
LIGSQATIRAVIGMILLSGTGALSGNWLIGDAEHAAAAQPVARHAGAGHTGVDRDLGEPDSGFFADPTTGLWDSDPTALDDFVCGGDKDRTEAMLQDWRPDHGEDSDDWLLALATLMGLAEAWNDDPAGPWNSCQM